MEPERIKLLNDRPPDPAGRYVLYWMQQAQRAACNPCARACGSARERARAGGRGGVRADGRLPGSQPAPLPLHAGRAEGDGGDAGAARHPLRPAPGRPGRGGARARARSVGRRLRQGLSAPPAGLAPAGRGGGRAAGGRGRGRGGGPGGAGLRQGRDRRAHAAAAHPAACARSSCARWRKRRCGSASLGLDLAGDLDPADVEGSLRALKIDRSVPPSRRFRGGTAAARARLAAFLGEKLAGYATRPQRARGGAELAARAPISTSARSRRSRWRSPAATAAGRATSTAPRSSRS